MKWPNLFKYVIRGNNEYNILDEYIHDIHKTTIFRSSILHFAIIGDNIDTIKYLIEKGAKINTRNMFGETPLHWCCKQGNLNVLKLLIQKGADLNVVDYDGNSLLHWVAEYNHISILKELLYYNVYNGVNVNNQTPLDIAIENESTEVYHLLAFIQNKIYQKE